jgi:transcriptional regulator with XRE-family HTH domain
VKTTAEYDEFLVALSQSLRDIRVSNGYTQMELAKKANRVQSSIAKLESSPSPDLALRVIFEIGQALSLPLSELFKVAENRSAVTKGKKKREREDSWIHLQQDLAALPPQKRNWVGKVVSDLIEGVQNT